MQNESKGKHLFIIGLGGKKQKNQANFYIIYKLDVDTFIGMIDINIDASWQAFTHSQMFEIINSWLTIAQPGS